MLKGALIVGCGGFIGTVSRYFLSQYIHKLSNTVFPIGTLIINLSGCLLIGILFGLFEKGNLISSDLRLFLTVGFCGGFTTFSTFSLETFNLLKNSEFLFASLNIFLSVFLCLAGTYLAYILSNR